MMSLSRITQWHKNLFLVEITHFLETGGSTETIKVEGILKASLLDVTTNELIVARSAFVYSSSIEERLHIRQFSMTLNP